MSIVGLELGEGRVTAVMVDEDGRVLQRAAQPLRGAAMGPAAADVVRGVSTGTADAIGVTLPFQVEEIPAEVSAALPAQQKPITAVNSGQALALAETWCGAARGAHYVVSFVMGEHVTAGAIVDGTPLRGARGFATSVAWLALNPVEREDYRRFGGLEAEVAAAGIVKRLVWRIKSGDRSRVTERVGGELTRLTAEDVFAAAREGDGVCISVVRDTAKYVGMAIANLATVVDPECVVLGGTLAAHGDLMVDAIRTECTRRLMPAQAEGVRIVLSALGEDAPAIGAARAAMLQTR